MKQREFISLLGSVAAAWPLAARAQQPEMPVIGYLSAGSPEIFAQRLRAFRQGLSEVGLHGVAIDYCWLGDRYDQLPAMAADLVRMGFRHSRGWAGGSSRWASASRSRSSAGPTRL
jgi:putative ABC transport system substrate-binding protein